MKGLFPNQNPGPKLMKDVSTKWYCNRDGIRDAYSLAESEKVCAIAFMHQITDTNDRLHHQLKSHHGISVIILFWIQ